MQLYQQLSFSSVSFGKSCLWTSSEYFLLAYFVTILDVSPGLAGVILLASYLFAAFADPVVAVLADRLRHRYSSLARLMLFGAALSSLMFVVLFSAHTVPGTASLSLSVVFLFAFRLAYAFLDVPHNTMLGVLTSDPHLRSRLAAQRQIFGSVAGMILTLVLSSALIKSAVAGQGTPLAVPVIILATLSFIVILVCYFGIRHQETRFPQDTGPHFHRVTDVIRGVATNRRLQMLLGVSILAHAGLSTVSRTIPFLVEKAGDILHQGLPLFAFAFAHAVSAYGWATLGRTAGKLQVMRLAFILTLVLSLFALWSSLRYEITGSMLIGMAAAFGIVNGGIFTLIWSLVADASDHRAEVGHGRTPALTFGVFTFVNKSALGLAAVMSGSLLDMHTDAAGPVKSAIVIAAFAPSLIAATGALAILSGLAAFARNRSFRALRDESLQGPSHVPEERGVDA